MTTLAIIGAGSVSRAICLGLAASGRLVTFGVRNPAGHTDLGAESDAATKTSVEATTPETATVGADAVVLAIPTSAVTDVVPGLGGRSFGFVAVGK